MIIQLAWNLVLMVTHPASHLRLIVTLLSPHWCQWFLTWTHVVSHLPSCTPMSPTLPCILSPEYQGWSCRHLPSCHHLWICQTTNKNSVTRFPGLRRQLLPQCLQARAWVNWPQRSPTSPSAPSRPSGSHSIFLSLVAVYPEVITASQNKELPSPTYLTAVSEFTAQKLLPPDNSYFIQWKLSGPLLSWLPRSELSSGIVVEDMDSSIKLPYSNPSSATSYLWNLKLLYLSVPQLSHL